MIKKQGRSIQQSPQLTIQEQLAAYVADIIDHYGIGHTVSTKEIKDTITNRYKSNRDSIIPSDYCYNRWNEGLLESTPKFFEYLDRSEYRVWGEGYLFNGVVLAHPKNGDEHEVGYCVDGQRYIGKLPVYPDDLPDDSPEYREGKRKSVKVNIYERNLAARQACIDQYGAICYICGFNFGETYGEEFEGMIHVHHIKMISELDHEYIIDPINDLRPVCPNCHMVLHSKKSGFTIDEVKAMLE